MIFLKHIVRANLQKIAIGGSTPSFGSLETDYGYGTKNATNAYTLGVCKGK